MLVLFGDRLRMQRRSVELRNETVLVMQGMTTSALSVDESPLSNMPMLNSLDGVCDTSLRDCCP